MRGVPLRRLALALAVTAAAAVAVLVVALREGWGEKEPVIATDERLSVSTDVAPRSHLFGDRLTARLEIVLNRAFVPADSVDVEVRFEPFRVERVARARSDHGGSTRLSFVYQLACLRAACLPDRELGQRTFVFPRARVSYELPGFGGPSSDEIAWPAVTTSSQMSATDFTQPSLRAVLRPLPATTYRVDPNVLAALALAGALVLVLTAVALVVPQLPRTLGLRLPAFLRRRPRTLTPLEQALFRLREAASNGAGDERRALENLALELALSGRGDLAQRARRLAWSPGRPAGGDVGDLSSDVELVVRRTR